MHIIARATSDLQRLAARRRPWHVVLAMLLAGGGAVVLLVHLMLAALHHGHPGAAGGLLQLAVLAGVVLLLSKRGCLSRLGWLGLAEHCLILACRAAAGCASARVRALAHARNCIFCIAIRQSKLIQVGTLVIIGNRLLPSSCISPRIISQRPN
jgi:hypothetical protein